MKLLCVGDVHTNIDALKELVTSMKNKVSAVLQVGDFELYQSKAAIDQEKKYLNKLGKKEDASRLKSKLLKKEMDPFEVPVYYIKGNHDDFDNLDSEYLEHLNIHYIPQGEVININGINIAGIGGIYSQIKSSMKSEELEGHDRRFYTKGEILELSAKTAVLEAFGNKVDILLTHQASHGVIPTKSKKLYKPFWDEGTKDFVELLKMPKLRWYIHGHHHVNYVVKKDSLTCVGLGNFNKNKNSYFIIDTGD